jgi:Lecithin retinol acyltransferase
MNTPRMLAFFAAVLITACLFRAFAYGLTVPQHPAAGTSVNWRAAVNHLESHYSPEEIVRRARSRLGESDYRLLTNNCEHFCNWCLSGVSRSAQVKGRLQLPLRLLGALFHA